MPAVARPSAGLTGECTGDGDSSEPRGDATSTSALAPVSARCTANDDGGDDTPAAAASGERFRPVSARRTAGDEAASLRGRARQ